MNLIKILRYITSHPLNRPRKLQSAMRFIKWQVGTRIIPYSVIYPFVAGTKLIVERGMTGATGNIYTGLHEMNEMGFLLHFLRKGDLFIDIGANVGSYSILAAGVNGASTISVEPSPATFDSLCDNIAINRLTDLILPFNVGLGSRKSVLKFTKSLASVNHVIAQGESQVDGIDVAIERLDDILINRFPVLMKIDVEGFEYEVLRGALDVLSNSTLKAIIVELNGSGARYGYHDDMVHNVLVKNGFSPYSYNVLQRQIGRFDKSGHINAIYIRDKEFCEARISEAPKINVLGSSI